MALPSNRAALAGFLAATVLLVSGHPGLAQPGRSSSTDVPASAAPLPPYVEPPPRADPKRHLALTAIGGVWEHQFAGDRFATKPGPVWGVSARIEPQPYLGIGARVLDGRQPVVAEPGALGQSTIDVVQPMLEVMQLSMLVEPQWRVGAGATLYGAASFGWVRGVAPEPETPGAGRLRSSDREFVMLTYELGAGARYEPVPDWLTLGLYFGASIAGSRSGRALESSQAFTPDGHRTWLRPIPRVTGLGLALFEIGIIL